MLTSFLKRKSLINQWQTIEQAISDPDHSCSLHHTISKDTRLRFLSLLIHTLFGLKCKDKGLDLELWHLDPTATNILVANRSNTLQVVIFDWGASAKAHYDGDRLASFQLACPGDPRLDPQSRYETVEMIQDKMLWKIRMTM